MTNVILMIGLLILSGGSAFAVTYHATGNPTSTSTGVNVVALGTLETFNFQVNSVQMPAVSLITDETSMVTSEYGFSASVTPTYVSVQPGNTVYHYAVLTIESNATTTGQRTSSYLQYNGANNWIVELWSQTQRDATLDATGLATSSANAIPRDTQIPYSYKVIVPASATDAPNGSFIIITNTIESLSTPYGEYTGTNYYTYGGIGYYVATMEDVAASPVLTLSRTSTVDASSTYTGGIHDSVPGSIVTYTLTYSNTGDAAAENVNIIAQIPPYSKLAHVNKTGSTANVNITAPAGNFSGSWEVWYSAANNPNMGYGNPLGDWVSIGSITSSGSFPAGTATYRGYPTEDSQYQAKWIKFERSMVGSGLVNQTVTWGVTIR